MTPNNTTLPNILYTQSTASATSNPFVTFYSLRDPTPQDINYPIQKRWVNFSTPSEWILESYTEISGVVTANWVELSSGGLSLKSLSDDVGTKVFPDDTGNIQIEGQLNEQTGFFQTVIANPGSNLLTTNPMSVARWIVDPLSTTANPNGTHTTIQSAINDAFPGDTILVMPGVYTEDLTLPPGINLTGLPGSQVIIIGNCTFTQSGSVSLSYLILQTNGNYALSVTGSASSVVSLNFCTFNCTNHTGINLTSSGSGSTIGANNCIANLATTGIAFWNVSNGTLILANCSFGNTGGSITYSNNSNGSVFIYSCIILGLVSTSSTGFISIATSVLAAGTSGLLNATPLVLNGTTAEASATTSCSFFSGTAPGITVNTSLICNTINLFTSNNTPITGIGIIYFSSVNFSQLESTISTSSQILRPFNGGRYLASSGTGQIAGLATLTNGTVTISNTNLLSNDMIILSRVSANGSTTLGELVYSISSASSFTITSLIIGTPGSTQTGDQSIFTYFIVRQA